MSLNRNSLLMRLELQSVSKTFGKSSPAVSGVSISVMPGEIYCLLGGSQSGKTVLVDLAMGLLVPTAGRVLISGVDPIAEPVRAREGLCFVSVDAGLRPTETVASNIMFFASLTASGLTPSRQDCLNALRDVGLPDRIIDRRVSELSRDSTLFIWLAIALLRKSGLIILDDPTRGITTDSARSLQSRLIDFKARHTAVLVATSDVLFASQVADRLGIVQRGRLTSRRTREQVLGLSLAQIYLDYLGELPAASVLPATGTGPT